jgi:hypothetical protein
MSHFYRDVRDRADAVRGIPLEEVLRATGAEQDRHDKAKWHTPQGLLSVTGIKFMNWKEGIGGGGAIDLVIHLYGFDFLSAVDWLSRYFPTSGIAACVSPVPTSVTIFRLPPRDDSKLSRVKQYLIERRKLPPDLVLSLIDGGRLYADNRANAVFLLLGRGNRPVGAELRGTSQRQWRGMAPGSKKDSGFFAVPAPDAEAVILCESAIDAISCAALYPCHYCMSTAGARPNPRWLRRYVYSCPVYCGFDADQTGDLMAKSMMARYPTVQRLRPPLHDWNDTLPSQA